METLVRRVASEKPESVTLPGFSWRSEIGYAETPQVRENMIGHRCRVNIRPGLRVYRFRHTSTSLATNPGNPKAKTRHLARAAARGATIHADPHESGTNNMRAGPQARATDPGREPGDHQRQGVTNTSGETCRVNQPRPYRRRSDGGNSTNRKYVLGKR